MDTGNEDMRNQILADIIDKMHERMASKMFPDMSHGDNEAASAEDKPAVMALGGLVPSDDMPPVDDEMPKMDDDAAPTQSAEEDELMTELMKQHGV